MKIEVFAFIAGIIVFFAMLGVFYFLLDNKSFNALSGSLTPTPPVDKLGVLGDNDELIAVPSKQQNLSQPMPTEEVKKTGLPEMTINPEKKYSAILETSEGDITLELYAEKTPQTVNNFIHLARTDYYDGTTFHRIMKDFMIQGGDPKGTGTGGPGYTVPAEIKDDLKHERGAISMARLPDTVNPQKESSGSQFFIMHKTVSQLDGEYTIFGKVIEGMDVVDLIAEKEVSVSASGENSKPVSPVTIENIKIIED